MCCSEVETLMVQAVQGQLPPSETARLHRHLSGCSGCQETYRQLRGVWDMLDAWTVPEPPAELAKSFSARLAEATAQSRRKFSLLQKLERPRVRLRLGWNLAGLALAAALVLGVFHVFNERPGTPATGPRGPILTDQRTPIAEGSQPSLVSERTRGGAVEEAPRGEGSRRIETVPLNRVVPEGVGVEPLPESRLRSGQVYFTVDNFPTDVPAISTKHYNTVFTLYEEPF